MSIESIELTIQPVPGWDHTNHCWQDPSNKVYEAPVYEAFLDPNFMLMRVVPSRHRERPTYFTTKAEHLCVWATW